MSRDPLLPFAGMDLYEKNLDSLTDPFPINTDQKRTNFIALYGHAFLAGVDKGLTERLRAREIVVDPQNPVVTLFRFKNYWDEKTPLCALKIAAPRAVKEIYSCDPQPMYLCHVNTKILGEVSRLAHEVKLFWDLRQAYFAAEQAIAANHYNLQRNFGVESNIERLSDYARFLRIWNRDYYIWQNQVAHVLDQLAYKDSR
jgi:hypothetical protein